jgi:threonine/homoserine/homoserine lactone efflux protein
MLTLAAALLPFAVAAAFTPGPNNLMLAASGANFGVRRSVPHILGIVAGFPLLVLAVGLGLGALFVQYPATHTVLKLAGATFLIVMAWRIATARPASGDGAPSSGRPLTAWEAALFQWINPKAWVFAVGVIATYTTVGGSTPRELGVILAVCLLVTVGSTVSWTLFGTTLNRWLLASPGAARVFNVSMGLLLALSTVLVMR